MAGGALVLAFVASAERAATETPVRQIRVAVTSASGPIAQIGATTLAHLANERLKDQVSIEIVTPEQNPSGDTLWRELEAGRFDMAIVPAPQLAVENPELALFEIPFLFQGLGEVLDIQRSDIGQVILASLASPEAFGLGFWNEGMTQLFAQREFARGP